MFGTLRLLLACMVVVSHGPIQETLRFNVGAMAVGGFYIISGFLMTELILKYYPSVQKIPLFYLDRISRLFPQYIAFAAIILLANHWTGIGEPFLWDFSFGHIAQNLLLAPLNYFMFVPVPTIIPQAWSLGAEVQFYAIIPFLLFFPIIFHGALGVTFLVFAAASLAFIGTDTYGYRLLAGTLPLFLLGSVISPRIKGALIDSRPFGLYQRRIYIDLRPIHFLAAFAVIAGFVVLRRTFYEQHVVSVLSSALVGSLGVLWLSRRPQNSIDNIFGNASYGTFLSHMTVIRVLGHQKIFEQSPIAFATTSVIIAVLLGWAGFYAVERPVMLWRRRLRERALRAQ